MNEGEQYQVQSTSDVFTVNEETHDSILQSKQAFGYEFFGDQWPGHADKSFSEFFYCIGKRLLDIIGAFLGLIVLLPLIIVIAISIKLDSPGPIFFRQMRIGKNRRRNTNGNGHLHDRRNGNLKGQPIFIYKFRTMKNNVEPYAISPRDNGDPRITRVGKLIRPLCLDELPQLLNVLKGELSLVGPRPEMPFLVKNYIPLETVRLLVKPGISGLWQLNAPRTQHIHENLHYDLDYIKRRSLVLDLKILLKTIGFIFRSKNI